MTLYVQETRPDAEKTIVFLHGGGGAGWMWMPQVEQLGEYHCLAPDLPEQGRSQDVHPFTIVGSAELIADLIRKRAHHGKAFVVGLSEGAQVGLALLAHAPELVERAILSSALVHPVPGAWMITPGSVRLSFRGLVAPLKNSDWWVRLNMKYSAGVPETYFEHFRTSFRSLTENGFANLMVENQRFRLPAGLDKVQTPTLVVCGSKEYNAMRRSVRDVARALPHGHGYEVVHNQQFSLAEEHNWNMTAPAAFTAMVRSWCCGKMLPEALKPVS